MAVNKVVYGNSTIVDLTNDTVTPETLAKGVTAHNKAGQLITGVMEDMGTKVSGTVKGDSLAFTNSVITNNSIIDGPYIEDVLVGVSDVGQSGTTITFTLSDDSADGKSAIIWVRN